MAGWVDQISNFTSAFTKFLDDKKDHDFIKYFEGTSGFVSLGFGIAKMIKEYKESLETEYEKSISDLFHFLFYFAADQIKTIIEFKKINEFDTFDVSKPRLKIELKKFLSDFTKESFSKIELDSPWLPLHPLIQKFKNETVKWLYSYPNTLPLIEEFIRIFESKIEYDLYKKQDLEEFRKIVQDDLNNDRLMAYLDFLIKDYLDSMHSDKINLSSVANLLNPYVEDRKSVSLNIKETWSKTDTEIYRDYEKNITNIGDILNKFLNEKYTVGPRVKKLIIAAPYGVGKTTIIKKLAYDCAKKRTKGASEIIPIVVYLKDGINIRWEGSIEALQIFQSNFNNTNSDGKIDRPVLLLLDALDEYSESKNISVMDLINLDNEKLSYIHKFSDLKIIYTTRLNKEFERFSELQYNYIRLLPFTEEQVKFFLQQNRSDLTYEELVENLDEEAITKPLILSILVKSFPKLEADFARLKEERKLTPELIKTLIYMQLFYDHYYGKYRETSETEYEDIINITFQQEKEILRLISYYKKIKKDLTIAELEDWSKQTDINIKNIEPVINTYFVSTLPNKSDKRKNNTQISFLHQTYEEFLLAEYLLTNYIQGEVQGLNVGRPSDMTISFLRGFLDLLNSDQETIRKFVYSNDNTNATLTYSINYKPESKKDPLQEIRKNIVSVAVKSFNTESIIIEGIVNSMEEDNSTENTVLKRNESIVCEINNYENLWLHRWVSLMVLEYLDVDCIKSFEKDKIENLINFSSNNTPYYLRCLSNANLSFANLTHAHLSDAKLKGTDLSHANLFHASLSRANLSGANLSDTHLSEANLFRTNLSGTNLTGANLFRTNLSGTNLTGANLTDADLTGAHLIGAKFIHSNLSGTYIAGANLTIANLSGANLTNTDLSNANLSGANLTNTDLSNANLSGANLSGANLSGANLSGANLSGANLSGANLSGANLTSVIFTNLVTYFDLILDRESNFRNAIIDDENFIIYLRNNDCSNIPDEIRNKDRIKRKTKTKKI